MTEEMKSIEDNGTWEPSALPTKHRAIGFKWVYKVKHNEVGDIVRHKARLVAKGYIQRAGVNYDEVFALMARLESVRMLVLLAAHKHWTVYHMDVKSAFLNETLKEEVYVQQLSNFIITDNEGKVLCLRKALYGYGKHLEPRMLSLMPP
jgi:hypothetical protein